MSIGGKVFQIKYDDSCPALTVDIEISSPDPRSTVLKLDNVLIDTGADFTLIPTYIIKELKLKWTGTVREIVGFNENMTSIIKFYVAKIKITDVIEELVEVGGFDSDPIIGMDLICKLHMLINCPFNTFEIATNSNYKSPKF